MALADKNNKTQAEVIAEAMKDEVVVDFSGASAGYVDVPPGNYDVVVKFAEVGTSKAGNQLVIFRLEITEPGDYQGQLLWKRCPTSGGGSGILRDAVAALGVKLEDGSVFKPSTTIGKKARAIVKPQKDNPEYNDVTLKALPKR